MEVAEQIKQVRKMVTGFKISQLLITSEQIGIFASLGEGCNIFDLSRKIHTDPKRVEPILNALVCNGILKKKNSKYILSENFSILSPSHPASQLGYIQFSNEVMRRWRELSEAIHGNSKAHENFRSITGEDVSATKAFLSAMHTNAKPQAVHIANMFNFDNHYVLDIGAGTGIYSIEIGKKFPNSRGMLVELPGVIPYLDEFIRKANLTDRFTSVPCDYRESLPNGEFDDVFLFAVIHQENSERVSDLFSQVRGLLKPGGKLFLSSFFLDESRVSPECSVMFAVEMLVMTPYGSVYSHGQIIDLLTQTGFVNVDRVDAIPGPATLYIAKKE